MGKVFDQRLLIPVTSSPLLYLVRDEFQTNESTPLANPRSADPGPGVWTVTDTANNLSVADDWLLTIGAASWGDPSLWTPADQPFDATVFGGVVAMVLRMGTTTTGPGLLVNGASGAISPITDGRGLFIDNYELKLAGTGAKLVANPSERLRSIHYYLAVIRLPGGADLLTLSGGAWGTYPTATIMYVDTDSIGNDLFVGWENGGGRNRTDWIRALQRSNLPTPLQTRFGASLIGDDFSRANGDLDGSTPTAGASTWDVWTGSMVVDTNQARSNQAGFSRARIDCGQSPRVIAMKVTTPASVSGAEVYLDFRDNGSNRLSLAMDTTQTYLFSSYTTTTIATHPATLPANTTFRVVVVDDGARVRAYRDNTLLIDVPTNDGSGETRCGFTTNRQDILFDDFEAWPSQVQLGNFGPARQVPQGTGTPIFEDTFTDTNGTPLTDHDASYEVTGTGFEIQNNAVQFTAPDGTGTAVVDAGSPDHEVSAVVTLPSDSDDGFNCGLVCRYQDAGNHILARYLNQGGGLSPEIELLEKIGGTAVVVAFVNLGPNAIPPGSVHPMKLAAKGKEIAVYHHGELVLQFTTNLLTGTKCGIGRDGTTHVTTPVWDNLQVRLV